ncbi:MAG: PKD domain-containing protein [Methanoregula sp.]|jgi:PKD repeat protein
MLDLTWVVIPLLLAGLAISILFIGSYGVIWYLLIQKIPGERTRLLIPIVLAAILIVITPWYDAALWSSIDYQQFVEMGIFLTLIRMIPFVTIIAMAAIVPFSFVSKCIGTRRPWLLVAIATGIGFFVVIARGFSSVFGATPTTPDVFTSIIPPSLLLMFPFIEVAVYSAAFYGVAVLFWYIVALPYQRWFRAIVFCLAALVSLFLLEWVALAGISIVIYMGIKRFRSGIVSSSAALVTGLLLALISPALIKISGAEQHFVLVLIPLMVMGCAVVSAFVLFAEKMRRELRVPLFFSETILSLLVSNWILTYFLNPTGSLLSWLVTVPGESFLRLYLILMFAMVFAIAAIIFWIVTFPIGQYLEKSSLSAGIRQLGLARAPDVNDVYSAVQTRMTPRLKLALIIVCCLLIVLGVYLIFLLVTDTTPGRTWTQVTSSAPVGPKGAFTTVEYNGKLWLIGGTGKAGPNAGSDGEAWYTSDGITWNRESSSEMVPQRMGASSTVFHDALWVIGGTTEKTLSSNNDIWCSNNGINWSEIQPAAEFSPRSRHSTVVFKDRIWVIGGDLGGLTHNFTSDVWYSSNGITWERATPAAGFSPRSGHSSFVYNNRMWVIGGQDSTGYPNDVWNSEDGIHWTMVTDSAVFPKGMFNAVVFDNRMWVIQNFYSISNPPFMDRVQGIWCSTDGVTWSNVLTSAQFFQKEYSGGVPYALVFDNRLWVFQWHGIDMGIWYTKPTGKISCKPSANFNADKNTGPAPLTVAFSDESFCQPDQWQWDFGDGSQSIEQNPKHTFTNTGNYTVSLVVKNSAGERRQSVNITVFKSLELSNPSAGKNWKLASDKVPFGNRQYNTVTVWNDMMWVIGGVKLVGSQGYYDTWYSRDGSHWTQATQNAGFEARSRHNSVVFNDNLWIIGGMVDHTNETGFHFPEIKNDTWYSSDGITWTIATTSAGFPPSEYTQSIVFKDRIWLFGKGPNTASDYLPDLILWSSGDGIHWNQSLIPPYSHFNRLSAVVKDSRIWVFQHESDGGFWNFADDSMIINATTPQYDWEKYAIYTDSLTVYDNKFWLFRALEDRESNNKMHGEVWSSDDGYNWVLITDAVPFAESSRALNDFHIVAFDKKLWAYMIRATSKPFSDRYDWKAEIWYTEME